ncbi:MAG: serine protease [Phycisphaerales bacterium]
MFALPSHPRRRSAARLALAALLGPVALTAAASAQDIGRDAPFIDGAAKPANDAALPARPTPPGLTTLGADLYPAGRQHVMPPVAGEFFMIEDMLETGGATRLQTGVVQPTVVNAMFDGTWSRGADGRWVWALEITSPGSKGLRARITDWNPPAGSELIVYDPRSIDSVQPAFTPENREVGRRLWTPTIWGDTLRIELVLPAGIQDIPDAAYLKVDSVVNCYINPMDPVGGPGPGTALACHIDWRCDGDYAAAGDAVALYHYVGDGFSFICTGALLNRTNSDFTPLLMTAWHCGVRDNNADTVEVYWRYQTSACGGTIPNVNTLTRSNGVHLLHNDSGTDWTLLGLDGTGAANQYLGWDAGGLANGTDMVAIHHPRGTFKKITYMTKTGNITSCIPADGFAHVIDNGDGEIEPGSSGGPILDPSFRVRGTGSCANWGCGSGNNATYGRLDLAYPNLAPWLSPASEVFVNSGYNGVERGTPTQPFDHFLDATFAVAEGGTVALDSGTYSGARTFTKAMTLESTGGSVTIGN